MNYKYNSIIINKFDIGETDRLYTLYTLEAGKIRAKAVGVKKPNAKLAGNLEPLMQTEIFIARGQGRGNITGTIAINNFLGIKSNISAIQKVFYVLGIFSRLVTNEEKDENIFELLLGYLKAMNILASSDNKTKMDIMTTGFLVKLLEESGYKIEVDRCVLCGKKLAIERNYFSGELGGVICPSCSRKARNKIKISNGAIKLIRLFLNNKLGNFGKISAPKEDIKNLKIVIEEEIRWIAG